MPSFNFSNGTYTVHVFYPHDASQQKEWATFIQDNETNAALQIIAWINGVWAQQSTAAKRQAVEGFFVARSYIKNDKLEYESLTGKPLLKEVLKFYADL